MRLVGLDSRGSVREAWLEVIDVAAVEALGVGAFAGIALDGDGDLLIGRKVPHDVDDVAVVLCAELDAELAADRGSGQIGDFLGGAEVGDLYGGGWLGGEIESAANFFGKKQQ